MKLRMRMLLMVVALAGLALGPAVAWAAEGGEAEKPPLLSFDPGTAAWSIIVFVGLMVILRLFAWKPILAGLQQRERFISDSIESARRERREAEQLLERYTEQIQRARDEATAIIEEGRRDADHVRRRIHEETRGEADAMLERAKREIGIARDHAIKELYGQSVSLASSMAEKLVGRQLTPTDHKTLLDESIADLSGLGPN